MTWVRDVMSRALWSAYVGARGHRRIWDEVDRFRSFDAERARAVLAARLRRQLGRFLERGTALEEWREVAAAADVKDFWTRWSALPVLTKHDLRHRFAPEKIIGLVSEVGEISATGGSTGEPTPYVHCKAMLDVCMALRTYCRIRFGWRPGMATLCVWGSERDIGKQRSLRNRISAYLRHDQIVGGFNLNEQTVEASIRFVRANRNVAIYGFTSMLEFVAREALRAGVSVPPGRVRAAWNGGEMLFDEQSQLFEQVFHVPILNCYGGRELGAIAFQPQRSAPLEVLRPFVFVEVLDESGHPVPPGAVGRVVVTSTVCEGTPFIRYDVGDLATVAESGRDESGVRQLHELKGRSAGIIELPDGRRVHNLFWNHLLKDFREIEQFQVFVTRQMNVELRVVGGPLAPERQALLSDRAKNFLGPTVLFSIRPVGEIRRSAEGKLIQVVRE